MHPIQSAQLHLAYDVRFPSHSHKQHAQRFTQVILSMCCRCSCRIRCDSGKLCGIMKKFSLILHSSTPMCRSNNNFCTKRSCSRLAFGEYEISTQGELLNWNLTDNREAFEYELPPFSIMQIRNSNDFVPPKYQKFLQLEISYDSRTYALEQDSPKELLEALNWHLYRCDPDILVTDYGDAILLPKLFTLSRQFDIPLLLNRDASAKFGTTKESSFFQYGKIVHKDGAFTLTGRWHVDAHNSFTVAEADLDGLFEMTRLTQMCGQRQGRASIGTSMSSMQLSWAYRNNVLIPSKKREPEEFKSAATLLLADRGGLIFNPPLGYHEDVAELDFASMYPSIMVNNNISPETINCRCCSPTAGRQDNTYRSLVTRFVKNEMELCRKHCVPSLPSARTTNK